MSSHTDYQAKRVTIVLESASPPPKEVVEKVAVKSGVDPKHVAFIYAPTQSLAGSVQVVGRVLEVATARAHELHFPLDHIVDGVATAPLSRRVRILYRRWDAPMTQLSMRDARIFRKGPCLCG